MEVLYVTPDYFSRWPKACMNGWARDFIVINPSGLVLPCHAASEIGNLAFDNVKARPLAGIWAESPAFESLSRRGVDEPGMQIMLAARNRLWRLPVSSLRTHWRPSGN